MDDNAFRFGTLTQQVKGWLRVSSPLKKAPGEGTGPTIHVDFRGNLVGRVPSRGEHDFFERAVSGSTPHLNRYLPANARLAR